MSFIVPSTPGPLMPLTETYTYHSPTPTADGPYIMGIDEAGRGPVLGPLVYGVAYCPVDWKDEMEELGFADSKTLSFEQRSGLLGILSGEPEKLGWSVRVISPQGISSDMMRRPPHNLNKQSQDATVLLIREVLDMGIQLTEIYVDALGNTTTYEQYLTKTFEKYAINFTVTTKADSKYKIVGAASVAAKVTRDACVEGWIFDEASEGDDSKDDDGETQSEEMPWGEQLGSGYPSDPKTQAWLKNSLDPVFGFPGIVRFSWTTVKVILDKSAAKVKWTDEGQSALVKAFDSATGREKDRCAVTRDLGIKSVGML